MDSREHDEKLFISMVGLPARGKTHFSRKLTRYLTWLGYNAKVFNIGDKRRKVLGTSDTSKADFFDPNNKEAVKQRDKLAEDTLTDVVQFLNLKGGNVAIFDGTNTTAKRRKLVTYVVKTYMPDTEYIFLEIVCTDNDIIEKNIMKTKIFSPDYAGWKEDDIISDFKERIRKYESIYEEIDPEIDGKEMPFIKSINCNENVIAHNIKGILKLKVMTFLLNLHLEDRPLYLIRHGQSEDNVVGRLGGDSSITEKGQKFASMLTQFFVDEQDKYKYEKFVVHTSCLKRTIQTASYLDKSLGIFDFKKPNSLLNEVSAGSCDGMTPEEIREKHPDVFLRRIEDKMGYRYPAGESYYDIINRLESFIIDLESSKEPTIIVSHNATLR